MKSAGRLLVPPVEDVCAAVPDDRPVGGTGSTRQNTMKLYFSPASPYVECSSARSSSISNRTSSPLRGGRDQPRSDGRRTIRSAESPTERITTARYLDMQAADACFQSAPRFARSSSSRRRPADAAVLGRQETTQRPKAGRGRVALAQLAKIACSTGWRRRRAHSTIDSISVRSRPHAR
jgi:hypothetical protein